MNPRPPKHLPADPPEGFAIREPRGSGIARVAYALAIIACVVAILVFR